MTNSGDDPLGSLEVSEAASQVKQQTVRQEERHIEGKQLSTRIQREISPEFSEKLRREEVYRERLRDFWEAAHRNSPNAESAAELEVFLRIMMDASEDLNILVADEEVSPLSVGIIAGNPQEVDLEVAERMSASTGQSELTQFMRSSIGPTIDRLERAGDGTPETRVDIVARVLFELRGSPAAASLACELYRYLQSQVERSEGYYQTVLNLAVIVSAAWPEYATESMFLYHAVLEGFRDLYGGQNVAAGGVSGNEGSRNLVSIASANLAKTLGRRIREFDGDARAKALSVLRTLRTISAVTCPVPAFERSHPRVVAAALGLPTGQPAESLAVLAHMAEMAETWGFESVGTSDLEASGGISAAADDNILRAVDLLFNAGVSLRAQKDVPESKAGVMFRARLLLNAVGLRLSLESRDDLRESLVDLDGIDCAVNFIGTLVEYKAIGDPGVVRNLEPLATEVAHFAKWPLLQRARRRTDLTRIERAATLLGIAIETRSTFPTLVPSVRLAIEALRRSFDFPDRGSDDVIVDSADAVGRLYGLVLFDEDSRQLQPKLVEIVSKRNIAMQVLIESYAEYATTTSADVGLGPAVAAGVVGEADWRRVAGQLRDPVTSIASAIAEFSPEVDR